MPAYRSRTTTHGRNMAGARGLWRATGMKNEDFGKPIIAYDIGSRGAECYIQLAKEILAHEQSAGEATQSAG